MNKELYGKLLKLSEDFEDYYGDDWDDLYYRDINKQDKDNIHALDSLKLVELLIENVNDYVLDSYIIKKFFDNEAPIGVIALSLYYRAIM